VIRIIYRETDDPNLIKINITVSRHISHGRIFRRVSIARHDVYSKFLQEIRKIHKLHIYNSLTIYIYIFINNLINITYCDKENRGRVHVTFFPPDCGFYGLRHVIQSAKIFAMRIGEKEKKKEKKRKGGKVARVRARGYDDTGKRESRNGDNDNVLPHSESHAFAPKIAGLYTLTLFQAPPSPPPSLPRPPPFRISVSFINLS